MVLLLLGSSARATFAPSGYLYRFEPDTPIIANSYFVQSFPQYESTKDIITRIAREYNLSPSFLIKVAKCESGLNQYALGDRKMSRGIFQIHKKYFPHITDEQAYDPEWSARFAAEKISNGEGYLWTCWRRYAK